MENKLNLRVYLDFIDAPNGTCCRSFYKFFQNEMGQAPGSKSKHQAWRGGYVDHLEETMSFAVDIYYLMERERKMSFSLSDAILVLFLHDIEKIFKYTRHFTYRFDNRKDEEAYKAELISLFGFELTDDHKNALKYVHGEGEDYSSTERVQGPLAAFVHICDVASARIWFDYPKKYR